jgi:hypothetical protein
MTMSIGKGNKMALKIALALIGGCTINAALVGWLLFF